MRRNRRPTSRHSGSGSGSGWAWGTVVEDAGGGSVVVSHVVEVVSAGTVVWPVDPSADPVCPATTAVPPTPSSVSGGPAWSVDPIALVGGPTAGGWAGTAVDGGVAGAWVVSGRGGAVEVGPGGLDGLEVEIEVDGIAVVIDAGAVVDGLVGVVVGSVVVGVVVGSTSRRSSRPTPPGRRRRCRVWPSPSGRAGGRRPPMPPAGTPRP